MTTELEVLNGKAKLPDDCKRLIGVKEDMNYMEQAGEVYFSVPCPDKVTVEYDAYDMDKINRANLFLRKRFGGFHEGYYYKALRICGMDEWFENYEKALPDLLQFWCKYPFFFNQDKTYHDIFIEKAEQYFERVYNQTRDYTPPKPDPNRQ